MTVKEQIVQAVQTGWNRYDNGSFMADRLASDIADELLRIWPVPVEAPVPSPGYVDCEIKPDDGCLMFCRSIEDGWSSLPDAITDPGFMGYVYSDGSMWAAPIRYKYKNEPKGIAIRSELVKDYVVERASHVRFAVK
jgi:hypothetical protein